MFEEQRKRIEAIADGIVEIQVLREVSRIICSRCGRTKIDNETEKDEQRQIGCLTPIKTSLDTERTDIISYVSVFVPGIRDEAVMRRIVDLPRGKQVIAKCLFGFNTKASSLTLTIEDIGEISSVKVVVD
jgi:hypothetical protein